jgi:hypothetical protein
MKYLSDSNAKTTKGVDYGFYTVILYLAPARESGVMNTCSHASVGCSSECIFFQGRGRFDPVVNARVKRTLDFAKNPKLFIENLAEDIQEAEVKANNLNLKLAVRLNGTSDLPFELLGGYLKSNLFDRFSYLPFYDYTKNPSRAELFSQGKMPKNYDLTFSRSENNAEDCDRLIKLGVNIATVFSTKKKDTLPLSYNGRQVLDGDISDLRFMDKKGGFYLGLRAKGTASKDTSGFVIHV